MLPKILKNFPGGPPGVDGLRRVRVKVVATSRSDVAAYN
jgi:hypothetical protein